MRLSSLAALALLFAGLAVQADDDAQTLPGMPCTYDASGEYICSERAEEDADDGEYSTHATIDPEEQMKVLGPEEEAAPVDNFDDDLSSGEGAF